MNLLGKFGKAFTKILTSDAGQSHRLGNPLGVDSGPFLARRNAMALMTGGRGFTTPAKEPRVHPTFGTTRGQRKRARRSFANLSEAARQERNCESIMARTGMRRDEAARSFGSL
ncbi:hypothetical protein [Mesorhizobium sp.]|uniref:hypothetical protein n=1 Tax=Mesorhizobium sp. TaxID=1871066 RepID=UPI000FEA768B|nr:hypothetical protein [Mesorhizobium sp.]RWP29501.1 MAG: hypothetical protein EOR03_26610 [Mesorhizobium sp.]RWP69515.1 MAG: hypothetical protein EOR07_03040 [Mesorhizobium sp.]